MGSGKGTSKRVHSVAVIHNTAIGQFPLDKAAKLAAIVRGTSAYFSIANHERLKYNANAQNPYEFYLNKNITDPITKENEFVLTELFKDCLDKDAIKLYGYDVPKEATKQLEALLSSLDSSKIEIILSYPSKDEIAISLIYNKEMIAQHVKSHTPTKDFSTEDLFTAAIKTDSIHLIVMLLKDGILDRFNDN